MLLVEHERFGDRRGLAVMLEYLAVRLNQVSLR